MQTGGMRWEMSQNKPLMYVHTELSANAEEISRVGVVSVPTINLGAWLVCGSL